MSSPISRRVPQPADTTDSAQTQRALDYMGLEGGERIIDITIDRVFIGSCTNARIEDLREAARIADGAQVADGVIAMVVPGSAAVKRQAEDEGIADTFRPGIRFARAGMLHVHGMNGDSLRSGERCASTSNRNFEGRQGQGGRTHLVSPAMAAAAAIHGRFVDCAISLTGGDELNTTSVGPAFRQELVEQGA